MKFDNIRTCICRTKSCFTCPLRISLRCTCLTDDEAKTLILLYRKNGEDVVCPAFVKELKFYNISIGEFERWLAEESVEFL